MCVNTTVSPFVRGIQLSALTHKYISDIFPSIFNIHLIFLFTLNPFQISLPCFLTVRGSSPAVKMKLQAGSSYENINGVPR
jgi:hypothetical protein